ncbi:hypothetical protein VTL71DRAFT_1353 [Oculimacula yallundae]|uniref:Uncharacterized protein n=1 Tax=Oculimacula yallundae TaxID=86028 RepID=A0ABR4CAL6_9HELO
MVLQYNSQRRIPMRWGSPKIIRPLRSAPPKTPKKGSRQTPAHESSTVPYLAYLPRSQLKNNLKLRLTKLQWEEPTELV